jgi:hypothetical protein
MVLCSECVVGTYVDGVELEMEIVEVSRAPRSCKNRASLTTEVSTSRHHSCLEVNWASDEPSTLNICRVLTKLTI